MNGVVRWNVAFKRELRVQEQRSYEEMITLLGICLLFWRKRTIVHVLGTHQGFFFFFFVKVGVNLALKVVSGASSNVNSLAWLGVAPPPSVQVFIGCT